VQRRCSGVEAGGLNADGAGGLISERPAFAVSSLSQSKSSTSRRHGAQAGDKQTGEGKRRAELIEAPRSSVVESTLGCDDKGRELMSDMRDPGPDTEC
jgi:hypothetical protein